MKTTKIGNACKTALAVAITGSLFAGTAQAQLAGHNVILVHGFQQQDLANPPANLQEVKNAGEDYWRTFWLSRAEARIDWGSDGRVEGGIAQQAYEQMRQISQQGLCNDFCIVVSHSTGDLVTRYLLENQARWLQSEGLQPLKILATLDYSGAGGGTELANLALSLAYNDSWYNWPLRAAVEAFTGIEPEPGKLGVVTSQDGPAALYFNHYPVLMNEGVTHSGVLGSETGNISVPVVNNTTLGGLQVDFASRTYNKRAWWQWWGSGDRYIEVPGSDQTDMSNLVYTTLNN